MEAKQNLLGGVVAGITPVLDYIDPKPQEDQPHRPPRPDTIVDRCRVSFERFREFTRGITCSAAGHALAVVRSLYPSVRLEAIDIGFARGMSDARIDEHEEEASESAIKLAEDLNLFGERENRVQ